MNTIVAALVLCLIASAALADEPNLVPGGAIQKAIDAELSRENAKTDAALHSRRHGTRANTQEQVTILRGK